MKVDSWGFLSAQLYFWFSVVISYTLGFISLIGGSAMPLVFFFSIITAAYFFYLWRMSPVGFMVFSTHVHNLFPFFFLVCTIYCSARGVLLYNNLITDMVHTMVYQGSLESSFYETGSSAVIQGGEQFPDKGTGPQGGGAPSKILISTPIEAGDKIQVIRPQSSRNAEQRYGTVWQEETPQYQSIKGKVLSSVDRNILSPLRSAIDNEDEVILGQLSLTGAGGPGTVVSTRA